MKYWLPLICISLHAVLIVVVDDKLSIAANGLALGYWLALLLSAPFKGARA